jgi:L-ascorbate metabolism protein UlaG (beta-lactamase superfamily)
LIAQNAGFNDLSQRVRTRQPFAVVRQMVSQLPQFAIMGPDWKFKGGCCPMRQVWVLLISIIFAAAVMRAEAQQRPMTSKCLAMADAGFPVHRISFEPAALKPSEVSITYLGHSTFLIESPKGIRIATDFTGYYGNGGLPTVVTMNHAHTSHYTENPDPGIKHVLRGWNPKGGYAHHDLQIKDVHIRSIPTNIRTWSGGTEQWGNSIFIFEVANLCIAHLGHLHHELTLQQLGQVGQLDVVMVPVDGTMTLDHDGMVKVMKKLRPRLIIPMHFFYDGSLQAFMARLGKDFDARHHDKPTIILSQATMPKRPLVLALPSN